MSGFSVLPAWHGCLRHDHNHCPDCRTCGCFDQLDEEGSVSADSGATPAQVTEQAQSIATLATALAEDTLIGPRYAAVRRLADMVDTLAAWVGDDR